jgi:hypothetical protein
MTSLGSDIPKVVAGVPFRSAVDGGAPPRIKRSWSLPLHVATRSSVQHKLYRNRHPHRDRLPTPAGRCEAPASDRLDRRLVEIRVPRRLFHLDPFHASLFGDIGLDDDGPLDTSSPGRIRVTWFHLIASCWWAGRIAPFTSTITPWPRPNASQPCASALISKPQSAFAASTAPTTDPGSWDDPDISFVEEASCSRFPPLYGNWWRLVGLGC